MVLDLELKLEELLVLVVELVIELLGLLERRLLVFGGEEEDESIAVLLSCQFCVEAIDFE